MYTCTYHMWINMNVHVMYTYNPDMYPLTKVVPNMEVAVLCSQRTDHVLGISVQRLSVKTKVQDLKSWWCNQVGVVGRRVLEQSKLMRLPQSSCDCPRAHATIPEFMWLPQSSCDYPEVMWLPHSSCDYPRVHVTTPELPELMWLHTCELIESHMTKISPHFNKGVCTHYHHILSLESHGKVSVKPRGKVRTKTFNMECNTC